MPLPWSWFPGGTGAGAIPRRQAFACVRQHHRGGAVRRDGQPVTTRASAGHATGTQRARRRTSAQRAGAATPQRMDPPGFGLRWHDLPYRSSAAADASTDSSPAVKQTGPRKRRLLCSAPTAGSPAWWLQRRRVTRPQRLRPGSARRACRSSSRRLREPRRAGVDPGEIARPAAALPAPGPLTSRRSASRPAGDGLPRELALARQRTRHRSARNRPDEMTSVRPASVIASSRFRRMFSRDHLVGEAGPC